MNTQLYGKSSRKHEDLDLMQLKPLTTEQYDKARETAIERTSKRIGERPLPGSNSNAN